MLFLQQLPQQAPAAAKRLRRSLAVEARGSYAVQKENVPVKVGTGANLLGQENCGVCESSGASLLYPGYSEVVTSAALLWLPALPLQPRSGGSLRCSDSLIMSLGSAVLGLPICRRAV